MIDSRHLFSFFVAVTLVFAAAPAHAEDGHRLWLRYDPLPATVASREIAYVGTVRALGTDPSVTVAARELNRAITGLLHRSANNRSPQVILGTIASLKRAGAAQLDGSDLGPEAYVISTNGRHIFVAGKSGVGVLYGTFALIRELQLGHSLANLNIRSRPRYALRLLNHWDNLDHTVERGYAGPSLWDWESLPAKIDQRYVDYARANASVGINGAVLNNVNADPRILTPEYLKKAAALADVFRPYGIRVYLSVRFSSPIEIGHLKTADPNDPDVRSWWKAKADEIYSLIPDFGGFLVKANSEGEPGPWDYHRTQANGANTIADALAPHHGTVFWRAFVYAATKEDRAKQAYDEFKRLDGKFRDNVIVQVKNGPIDFQPREPFSPLFGQMPHTQVGLEVQLTREYLGQRNGITFLAPMWTEVLDSDTCAPRCGTPVQKAIAAVAGVSNVGSNPAWTATNFDQANWYAFGRLAWDPSLPPRQIADEWTRMTWSTNARAVQSIAGMMLNSREAAVDYMTPLGLVHQFQNDHHYGPAPWSCNLSFPSWNPCYYNKADQGGIGFDRTRTGSDAIDQYAAPIARALSDPKTTPDKYLLFFHHLPWTYRMRGGRTLWTSLIDHYDLGVATIEMNRREWLRLRPSVDQERFAAVSADLTRQVAEAHWWRDASIAYWQSLSNLPLPPGHSRPVHPLSWYQRIHIDAVPGFKAPMIASGTPCVASVEGGAPCVP